VPNTVIFLVGSSDVKEELLLLNDLRWLKDKKCPELKIKSNFLPWAKTLNRWICAGTGTLWILSVQLARMLALYIYHLFGLRIGSIFVVRVWLGQPSLVWSWVWKIYPKHPKFFNFSLLVKKYLFGTRQKVPGSKTGWPLIYAGQKYDRVGSGPISLCLPWPQPKLGYLIFAVCSLSTPL